MPPEEEEDEAAKNEVAEDEGKEEEGEGSKKGISYCWQLKARKLYQLCQLIDADAGTTMAGSAIRRDLGLPQKG